MDGDVTLAVDSRCNSEIGLVRDVVIKRISPLYIKVIDVPGDVIDLREFKVYLNRKRAVKSQFNFKGFNLDFFLGRKYVLEMALCDIFNERSDRHSRYIPKFILNVYSTLEIFDLIDSLFSCENHIVSPFHVPEFENRFEYRTVGLYLYAMLLYKSSLGGFRYDNINLRLLILVFSVLATSTDEMFTTYMTEVFKWLVLNTCDSCVEKVFLSEVTENKDLYNLDSFGDDTKPFWLKEIKVAHKTMEHGTGFSDFRYVVRHLSHSVFAVSGKFDVAVVCFAISNSIGIEISLNFDRAIALREIISRVVRATRASRFGVDEYMITWFRELFKQ